MQREARWIVGVVGLTLLLLFPMAAFNYYIDPMWTFAHKNDYNTDQMPFDERQQKTNQICFQPQPYDGLLIGSSRCTYMDPHVFSESVYNYAVSNIQLSEYASYIRYANEQMGPFQTVYVGLDFYGTNQNQPANPETPEAVIEKANEPGYRWKLLLSGDTFQYAWKNYVASQETQWPVNFAYNRDNVKRLSRVSLEETQRMEQEGMEKYRQDIYRDYVYAPVTERFQEIQWAAPTSEFVAFTTPVHEDFFALILEMGLYEYYEQWLRDSVESFGQVYHFMYINDVTRNLENFYDGSHVYPDVAAKMVAFIENPQTSQEDFGIVLTPENLEESLEMMRERAQESVQKTS